MNIVGGNAYIIIIMQVTFFYILDSVRYFVMWALVSYQTLRLLSLNLSEPQCVRCWARSVL